MIDLGLDEPSKMVSAGEVMRYVYNVVLAERRRLASIVADMRDVHPHDLAAAIASDDHHTFEWPQ